jgi:hypothetical protein
MAYLVGWAVVAVLVVGGLRLRFRHWGAITNTQIGMLAIVLLAPAVYPWQILWALALVPFVRGASGWTTMVFAATSVVGYRVWDEPAGQVPAWLVMIMYAPVCAAMVTELVLARRRPPCDVISSCPG